MQYNRNEKVKQGRNNIATGSCVTKHTKLVKCINVNRYYIFSKEHKSFGSYVSFC